MRGGAPFQVLHTDVNCLLDFEARMLYARTILYLRSQPLDANEEKNEPTSMELDEDLTKRIFVNFGLIDIATVTGVFVDGHKANWEKTRTFERTSFPMKKYRDLQSYDTLYSADVLDIQEKGEMCIELPKEVNWEPCPEAEIDLVSKTGLLTLTVEYSLPQNSNYEGFRFVVPQEIKRSAKSLAKTAASAKRKAVRLPWGMFKEELERQLGQDTRKNAPTHHFPGRPKQFYTHTTGWFPCVDSLVDRYTFDLTVTLQKGMVVVAGAKPEDKASGSGSKARLMQQLRDVELDSHSFRIRVPILASQFAFAAGEFEELACEAMPDKVSHFAPKGSLACLKTTTEKAIPELLAMFKLEVGPFPFPVHHQVFVNEPFEQQCSFAGIALLSHDLLHNGRLIDQKFETTEVMAQALAWPWAFHLIRVKLDPDLWIPAGVAGYLNSIAVERLFGYSEVLYRRAVNRYHRDDQGKHIHADPVPLISGPPAPCEGPFQPRGRLRNQFLRWKSQLVIEMLVQMIGTDNFRMKFLRELAKPKHKNTLMDTARFQKLVRRISSNKDSTEEFFKRWVLKNWCPELLIKHQYRRSKNRNEFQIKWLNKGKTKRPPEDAISGNIRIVSYEQDQTATPHWLKLQEEMDTSLKVEVPTKPPRRNAVKKSRLGNDTSVRFVRIDPDQEWLVRLNIYMERKFGATQLWEDWNIDSQMSAISSLRLHPGRQSSEALLKCLRNPEVYFKVRLEAARAMAEDRHSATVHQNTDLLIRYIKSLRYTRRTKRNPVARLLPNDFTDLAEYHIVKEIPKCLARIHNERAKVENKVHTKTEVINLIADMLKQNNNAGNWYSDVYYIASLIDACGGFYSTPDVLAPVIEQIKRFLEFDSLAPSHRGVITQACLRAFVTLEMNAQIKSPVMFANYMLYGKHPDDVRVTAFECLVKLSTMPKMRRMGHEYLCKQVKKEKDPGVRIRMLRGWRKLFEQFLYLASYQKRAQAIHASKDPTASADPAPNQWSRKPDKQAEWDTSEHSINYMPTVVKPIPDVTYLQTTKEPVYAEHLWALLTRAKSEVEREEVYGIYMLLFGKRLPPSATREHKLLRENAPNNKFGAILRLRPARKRNRVGGPPESRPYKRIRTR